MNTSRLHAKSLSLATIATLLLMLVTAEVFAHSGRGFEIEVKNGKLQLQGVNNGGSDGAPAVRPYLNSIHDHWSTYVESIDQSSSTFPELEVAPQVAFSFLEGYEVDLEFVAAWQWAPPLIMPPPGTVPNLQPLDDGEVISIQTIGAPITSESLGVIQLSAAVPAAGTGDIVPSYTINGSPAGKIHVLQVILTAIAPDASYPEISASDPAFLLLSPRGDDPVQRLHHASLYLEEYLAVNGLPIPEPSVTVLSILGCFFMTFQRRRMCI